jgi:hypothetical protein
MAGFQLSINGRFWVSTEVSEPVRGEGYYEREIGNPDADEHMLWLFRNRLVIVEPPIEVGWDEMVLALKHAVLSKERAFEKMQRELDLFERLEESSHTPRQPIAAAVRTFVWNRDGRKCVQCGSNERLEFDHIVPLAKGGSNTERNIQLLCEPCNRAKGASI